MTVRGQAFNEQGATVGTPQRIGVSIPDDGAWNGQERRSGEERRSGRDRRGPDRYIPPGMPGERRSGRDRRGHPFYVPASKQSELEDE